MTPRQEMEVTQVLDTFGELLAALAALAVKVPAKSFMAIPGGLRPTEEAIEKYEAAVYRFRDRAGITWRVLNGFFIDALEEFDHVSSCHSLSSAAPFSPDNMLYPFLPPLIQPSAFDFTLLLCLCSLFSRC